MNVITDITSPGTSQTASHGLTRALSEQARTLSYADLPDDVRALARQCVLDYVACTLAGAKEELADILLAEMAEQGGAPVATVIGRAERLPVLSAALVNGAASHALDFDDVNLAMTGHPTVVLLSALLALAEERSSPGVDVHHSLRRGLRAAMPARAAARARPLQRARLPCHRHARKFRRRGCLRASAWSRRGAIRHCARHRGNAGSRAEVDVRHDVQTAACRKGRVSRTARRAAGQARVHQPRRRAGVPARLRSHPQPGLQSGRGSGNAAGRLPYPQQSVQVPRGLLHDPRADRGRAQAARAAWTDPRPHRAHQAEPR